jgi:hypothetical protein
MATGFLSDQDRSDARSRDWKIGSLAIAVAKYGAITSIRRTTMAKKSKKAKKAKSAVKSGGGGYRGGGGGGGGRGGVRKKK